MNRLSEIPRIGCEIPRSLEDANPGILQDEDARKKLVALKI